MSKKAQTKENAVLKSNTVVREEQSNVSSVDGGFHLTKGRFHREAISIVRWISFVRYASSPHRKIDRARMQNRIRARVLSCFRFNLSVSAAEDHRQKS